MSSFQPASRCTWSASVISTQPPRNHPVRRRCCGARARRAAGWSSAPDRRRRIGDCSVTSRAQVRRLLSLVPYLREHDGVAMTDVATAFGITLKTLREDLSVLWMCGMPGLTPGDLIDIDMDAVDGEGVIHLSNADYLTRPLRLSADEALALVLALRTLREVAGPGKRDAVDRALKKLEAAAGNTPATDQATVAVTAARDDIQARVNDGLQRGKRIDLTYDVASRAETTRRMVDPLRVFVLDGYGYLGLGATAPKRCGPSGSIALQLSRSPRSMLLRARFSSRTCRQDGSRPSGRSAGHSGVGTLRGLDSGVLPDRGSHLSSQRGSHRFPARNRPRLAA